MSIEGSGQTTPQILIRFRPDVIALKPKAVVILAGTNDIAGNTGPTTLEAIEDNLMSMAELAKVNRIRVVLASVLPVCDYIKPQAQRRPPEKIEALNIWLKNGTANLAPATWKRGTSAARAMHVEIGHELDVRTLHQKEVAADNDEVIDEVVETESLRNNRGTRCRPLAGIASVRGASA